MCIKQDQMYTIVGAGGGVLFPEPGSHLTASLSTDI